MTKLNKLVVLENAVHDTCQNEIECQRLSDEAKDTLDKYKESTHTNLMNQKQAIEKVNAGQSVRRLDWSPHASLQQVTICDHNLTKHVILVKVHTTDLDMRGEVHTSIDSWGHVVPDNDEIYDWINVHEYVK